MNIEEDISSIMDSTGILTEIKWNHPRFNSYLLMEILALKC